MIKVVSGQLKGMKLTLLLYKQQLQVLKSVS